MGSPKDLSPSQIGQLDELTRDAAETDKIIKSGADGTSEMTIPMNSNDIVLVKLVRNQDCN
jgi:xylan 1,4-beta-xylosidase